MKAFLFFIIPSLLLVMPTGAKANSAVTPEIVRRCVDIVHQTKQPDFSLNEYFLGFDAYVDASSGLVSTNATVVGDMKPLFKFKKCMSDNGMPLK